MDRCIGRLLHRDTYSLDCFSVLLTGYLVPELAKNGAHSAYFKGTLTRKKVCQVNKCLQYPTLTYLKILLSSL
jgi:hypothetical protein